MNGHKSTQQQVQLLFQGVQLNINNPNFLIMQGRITKVSSCPLDGHIQFDTEIGPQYASA
jgi:hypothetical protein